MFNKSVKLHEWSIKVFKSNSIFSKQPDDVELSGPTLQASDISDVPAGFVADPFIITYDSKFYMFFEVYNKKSERGEIGLATSFDGEKWCYERIVLSEQYHLSYPHVFKFRDEFYMIPESIEAKGVFLYKAKGFPYEWDKVTELINGNYLDSSIFEYRNKWWIFTGSNDGNLHLFYSDTIKDGWTEHPNSPIISKNYNVTRPAGRVIMNERGIYRFTQDNVPYYGKLVRSFKINKLSETEYEEEEVNIVLNGSNKEGDWRKDGMHHIDQLKINENQWLVAVDGHAFYNQNYWKCHLKNFLINPVSSVIKVLNRFKEKF